MIEPLFHDIADRHYTQHDYVPFEEDLCHEFKGHASISVYDIPVKCLQYGVASRNAVSS